jgi:nucleoporin NUP2
MLRVKRHKDTDARRLLLRNSSTGKILIVSPVILFLVVRVSHWNLFHSQNFNIYPGLQPKLAKKAISFIGHDDGKPANYSVRSKTDDQAAELQNVLSREIAFVKAKQAD